jgi:flotillin
MSEYIVRNSRQSQLRRTLEILCAAASHGKLIRASRPIASWISPGWKSMNGPRPSPRPPRARDRRRGKVTNARATEIAERDKIINVIAARKAAETNAMPITVMAEAERQAAANKAEATNVLARADADAATTRAAGVKALGQAEAEVARLKAEARNKLSPAMVDYDLTLARINVIPGALTEAVKPIEKISDIRIFDTGSLLGRGGNGHANGHANGSGLGLGDGLAAQLLSVSAFKPIIHRILAEAGFAAGPHALTSLTQALAAQQLASPAEPSGSQDNALPPPAKPPAV